MLCSVLDKFDLYKNIFLWTLIICYFLEQWVHFIYKNSYNYSKYLLYDFYDYNAAGNVFSILCNIRTYNPRLYIGWDCQFYFKKRDFFSITFVARLWRHFGVCPYCALEYRWSVNLGLPCHFYRTHTACKTPCSTYVLLGLSYL